MELSQPVDEIRKLWSISRVRWHGSLEGSSPSTETHSLILKNSVNSGEMETVAAAAEGENPSPGFLKNFIKMKRPPKRIQKLVGTTRWLDGRDLNIPGKASAAYEVVDVRLHPREIDGVPAFQMQVKDFDGGRPLWTLPRPMYQQEKLSFK